MKKLWCTKLAISIVTVLTMALALLPVSAAGEWYAEYFNNPTLSGGPVLTRYEAGLHFEWGNGSPGDGIPVDNFSARFTHDEWFNGGTYRFSYRSDDGLRLWVDDVLIIDDWRDREATWSFVDRQIAQGTHHVRVEYYEHGGGAALQVAWERVSGGAVWRADYFGNTNLSDAPLLTRYDAAIDFDWGDGSPDAAVPADSFSVRWTRTLGFEAGTYRFNASCDDGVRIFVDDHTVVDAWQKQQLPNTRSGDITLGAGQHTVRVEYFEEGGQASAHAWWNRLDALTGWEGRYFDNRELRGSPALIRDDAAINFDWGEGAPATWMPSDNFSAQWVRQVNFKPGLYRFNVRSDDGMRLWLDDVELRMNYWEPQDFAWHYQDWHYLEGPHTLRVEYFEAAGGARIQFWWNYAATVEAARAMPPSPTYGFATAPIPSLPTSSPPEAGPPDMTLPGPWQGEYFNGRDLTKTPVLVRSDAVINFDWGRESPAPEIPANQFAVRWTGTFTFDGGRYRIATTTDDGVRVYVDDRLVLNAWRPMRGTRYATVDLDAGQHAVRVEYFEATQAAKARVTWAKVGEGTGTVPLPVSTPVTPSVSQAVPGPWDVRYYDNATLSGDPVVQMTHNQPLDFTWRLNAPVPGVPKDRFSAVFQRTIDAPQAGRYTFTTTSDDGVRLYVDDKLVISAWYPMRGTRRATVELPGGSATIRLEYFERTGAANVRLTWKIP